MKRIIFVLALSLSLAGCFRTVSNPLANNNPVGLVTIESAYGVALSGAVAYRNRPRCTKTALESVSNICARRSIVLKLQNADRRAQIALGRARAFIANNPSLDASAVIQVAQDAVSFFYNIQQGAL